MMLALELAEKLELRAVWEGHEFHSFPVRVLKSTRLSAAAPQGLKPVHNCASNGTAKAMTSYEFVFFFLPLPQPGSVFAAAKGFRALRGAPGLLGLAEPRIGFGKQIENRRMIRLLFS